MEKERKQQVNYDGKIINKKPKSEHKFKGLISAKEGYKNYKARYPKTELTSKEYSMYLEHYLQSVRDFLLDGGTYKLPYRLGNLKIIKIKRNLKKLKPNWKETIKLWNIDEEAKENKKLVYHLNEHSQGYYYRLFWERGNVRFIKAVAFLPIRGLKSDLAEKIKNENKDYFPRRLERSK